MEFLAHWRPDAEAGLAPEAYAETVKRAHEELKA
jgi:hypothetical protein